METPAIIMLVFFVIVIPVVLGIGSDVFKRWISHREKMMELTANQTAERAAQYAAHVERLEQRMRVLERIATDKGADLAAQIEDLRDQAPKGDRL